MLQHTPPSTSTASPGGGYAVTLLTFSIVFHVQKEQQRKTPSVLYLIFSVTFLMLDLG